MARSSLSSESVLEALLFMREKSGGLEAIVRHLSQPKMQALQKVPAVQVRHIEGDELAPAIWDCIVEATKQLATTDRVLLDAALNLGLLKDAPKGYDSLTETLYRPKLASRRQAVQDNWAALHTVHQRVAALAPGADTDTPAPNKPNFTDMRNVDEKEALTRLASRLLSLPADQDEGAVRASTGASDSPSVVVIGGAVMDVSFRLPDNQWPAPSTSEQCEAFNTHPGGKGLTQAVACARLGLSTTLIAAIGDDHFGGEIMKLLEAEGVDTSLIKRIPDQLSPVTGVISYRNGTSVALGWKNEHNVRLDPTDLRQAAAQRAIRSADVVLLTFELTDETVNDVLKQISDMPRRSRGGEDRKTPSLIVTPAPPFPVNGRLVPAYLDAVEFLVSSEWEADKMMGDAVTGDSDNAKRMHDLGIGTFVWPTEGQVFTFQAGKATVETPSWQVPKHDETGERDALCAALAYLIATGEAINEATLRWATAAMATSSRFPGVVESMPTLGQIEQLVKRLDESAWVPTVS